MPGIGTVERLVAEREVRNNVALDYSLEQRPLKPGRVAQVTACNSAVGIEPQPTENVSAKAFDKRNALAGAASRLHCNRDFTRRNARKYLVDQSKALLDLAYPDPHAGIDVTFLEQRNFKPQ